MVRTRTHSSSTCRRALGGALALTFAASFFAACRQDMHDQPRLEPYEASVFFDDGRAMRRAIPGTVARGFLNEDEHLHTGRVDGELAAEFPFPLTRDVLERGRERYQIFCAPCHDSLGTGEGMIVQRGMKRPESFHTERLRAASPGYYFDAITNGFGAMYDFSDRIPARDRWAIAGFIQVLQRSQNATLADVPDLERERLEEELRTMREGR